MVIEFKTKPGIVAYLTAGDPDLQTTREIALAAIDNGADVIELGVPFSDPLADGPVIQRASERSVARGVRLTDVLEIARQLRAARPACGIVIFSYLNPVVRMGMKQFCAAAKAAGADGVLLTDMIVEEAGEYLAEMQANELAPVFLAAPTSPDVRLKAIAEASRGICLRDFAGGDYRDAGKVAGDASELVGRLRRFTVPLGIPIAVGFGISNAEHVRAVGEFADAAVIGSALVALIEKTAPADAPAAVGKFIAGLRA